MVFRTHFFSRKFIRLALPLMALIITPSPLLKKEAGEGSMSFRVESDNLIWRALG
mgnify:CR=1 FL=1